MSQELHTFDVAVQALKQGHKVRRAAWKPVVPSVTPYKPKPSVNDKSAWPEYMLCQIRVGKNGKEDRVTWHATATDIMAEDWIVEK